MVEKLTEDQINENTKNEKFVLYGADWCGFCVKAKRLMEQENVDFEYISVTDESNMKRLKTIVPEARTIPQIFTVDSDGQEAKHVGGYSEFSTLIERASK